MRARGAITSLKTPTTPEDPSIGLMTGIKAAAARDGFALADIGYLLHGTTIATNAVLERKLPQGALVTTARFEDVVEIGRHYRREIYALNPQVPPTLIPRDRRIGIEERIRADGSIEVPLTAAALEGLVAKLDGLDVASVAVCLLNAYVNPQHERRIAEHLAQAQAGAEGVVLQRAQRRDPRVRAHIDDRAQRPADPGDRRLPRQAGAAHAGRALQPAPAAGAVERRRVQHRDGGGRSRCACCCRGRRGAARPAPCWARRWAKPTSSASTWAAPASTCRWCATAASTSSPRARSTGCRCACRWWRSAPSAPAAAPIAKVRPGGRLTVGPESAGSRPGPACYGRGGTEPTVTDANVALGRLDGESFLGGGMRLDGAAARAAIDEHVARPLGLTLEAGAEGLLAVTNANLGAAIRLSLFEKGLDPRDFVMIAFGGAAGLHAIAVADELGIAPRGVPRECQHAVRLRHPALQPRPRPGALAGARRRPREPRHARRHGRGPARGRARRASTATRFLPADRQIELAADMRYKGQAFELTVPADGNASRRGRARRR